MYSTVSPFGTAPIRCTWTSGIRWLTTGRLKASAMPATFSHWVMPPTRTRSTIGTSTERASIMWRNGTMPQTYSPPATGVDSASVTRARPGIVVGGRHVLEPEQPDPGILDAAADIDRLLGPPALVDVAHQLDVRADRLADLDHALDLDRRRRLARQRELRLHLAPALVLQRRGGLDHAVERQFAHQRAAGIGRHPLATRRRAAATTAGRAPCRGCPTAPCRAPRSPD